MQVSIHSLYWNNSKDLYVQHKRVMDHLGIPVNYHNIDGIRHGEFCDLVMQQDQSDIIGFMDIDCIPISAYPVQKCIDYVINNKNFVGLAQSANHLDNGKHICAAVTFFFIHKECYEKLGKPSFLPNYRSDVSQELSRIADEIGVNYRAIIPSKYIRDSHEGEWKLGRIGKFGIGTYYDIGIFHLYQGRMGNDIELFKTVCDSIISGNFSTENMISCTEL